MQNPVEKDLCQRIYNLIVFVLGLHSHHNFILNRKSKQGTHIGLGGQIGVHPLLEIAGIPLQHRLYTAGHIADAVLMIDAADLRVPLGVPDDGPGKGDTLRRVKNRQIGQPYLFDSSLQIIAVYLKKLK